MCDFSTIFNHELKSLVKSAKSTILSLFLVSFFWGIFFSFNVFDYQQEKISTIYIVFFAFVASSGFANTSFLRERLAGSWEILLSSGISRRTVFWAKLVFVQTMSFFCGIITLFIAFITACFVWNFIMNYSIFSIISLFFYAALSINIFTAYFTIININQRAVQLINMGIMSICSSIIYFIPSQIPFYEIVTLSVIIIPAIPILFLCKNALYKDKTILPVVY